MARASAMLSRAGRPALAMVLMAIASMAPAAAQPSLLYEPATDTVLHAVEIDRPWFPASLTKLMTAYVVFEAVKEGSLDWAANVPISEYARGQPATRLNLRLGIAITVEQAVHGLILRSANDLAVALAEVVSGSEEAFVARMNATARRLGLARTKFANPHGLPGGDQVTTARDMAILGAAIARNFPDRMPVFSAPLIGIHKGAFANQNDLLVTLPGADGMKTGFTCGAGYNIVASAGRDGRWLVAVVLGEPNRVSRSKKAGDLIAAGFAAAPAVKAESRVALSGLPVEGTLAEAADASRKMRLRKCPAPERAVRATASLPQPRLDAPADPAAAGGPADPAAARGPARIDHTSTTGDGASAASAGAPHPPRSAGPVLPVLAPAARPAVAKATPAAAAPPAGKKSLPAERTTKPTAAAAPVATKAKPVAASGGGQTAGEAPAARAPLAPTSKVKPAEQPAQADRTGSDAPEFPQAR